MPTMKIAGLMVLALGTFAGLALTSGSQTAQPQANVAAGTAKQLGTVKSISGMDIVLTTDSGTDVPIQVQDSTRIVRIAPGEKNLKNAVAISLRDLQAGDRILVRGKAGDSGQLIASGIIVMKLSDLEVRQQHEREEWQKRGVAGLVNAVDVPAGNITITMASFGGKKTVTIHTSKETVIKRYAPDSVRFDDAQPSTLEQIRPGDQLRALGSRSGDGTELTADAIVSGAFRNIAGTVDSVDASSGIISVLDSATKKRVTVKVTADSELRNLPPEMAKVMAMRLMGAGGPPGGAGPKEPRPQNMEQRSEAGPGAGGRRGDVQQIFSRLPPLSISDMHKGDTVMLVSTEGTSSGAVTAIKLLDGVEPILAAAPKSGGEMTLSPWSLGGQGGEDANP